MFVAIVRLDFADPPGDRLTIPGLGVEVRPGCEPTVRVMLDEKPFTLNSVRV